MALIHAFGHPIVFFGGSPRWWVTPLSLCAAAVALALAVHTLRRSRQSSGAAKSLVAHLLVVLLFAAFLCAPLFWLLLSSVGAFSLLLILPYDLALASLLVLVLRRVGVLS